MRMWQMRPKWLKKQNNNNLNKNHRHDRKSHNDHHQISADSFQSLLNVLARARAFARKVKVG